MSNIIERLEDVRDTLYMGDEREMELTNIIDELRRLNK
jgi:hypothetical protein